MGCTERRKPVARQTLPANPNPVKERSDRAERHAALPTFVLVRIWHLFRAQIHLVCRLSLPTKEPPEFRRVRMAGKFFDRGTPPSEYSLLIYLFLLVQTCGAVWYVAVLCLSVRVCLIWHKFELRGTLSTKAPARDALVGPAPMF